MVFIQNFKGFKPIKNNTDQTQNLKRQLKCFESKDIHRQLSKLDLVTNYLYYLFIPQLIMHKLQLKIIEYKSNEQSKYVDIKRVCFVKLSLLLN